MRGEWENRPVPADKPRHLQSTHDMVLSLAPLVLVILAMAGLARACTFSPGGPTEAAPPTIDVTAALTQDARDVEFVLRLPTLPEGWVSNSDQVRDVGGAGGGESVRTGFITSGGSYLRLVQSSATEDRLVADEVGTARTATGAVDVAGRSWVVYGPEDGARESVWVADEGDLRLLITGSGTEDEFRGLAEGVLSGQTLPG